MFPCWLLYNAQLQIFFDAIVKALQILDACINLFGGSMIAMLAHRIGQFRYDWMLFVCGDQSFLHFWIAP